MSRICAPTRRSSSSCNQNVSQSGRWQTQKQRLLTRTSARARADVRGRAYVRRRIFRLASRLKTSAHKRRLLDCNRLSFLPLYTSRTFFIALESLQMAMAKTLVACRRCFAPFVFLAATMMSSLTVAISLSPPSVPLSTRVKQLSFLSKTLFVRHTHSAAPENVATLRADRAIARSDERH